MPKRQNPFGDASPLQMKAHISNKEVDMGVNSVINMSCVYERTKSLLFEGAKKMSPVKVIMREEDRPVLKPLPGQCRLSFKSDHSEAGCVGTVGNMGLERPSDCGCKQADLNGNSSASHMPDDDINMETVTTVLPKGQMQIDSSGHLQVAKSCNSPGVPFKLCYSCLRPSPLEMKGCDFCDRSTCISCMNQCHSCQGHFCQVCSVINYDACLERIFCLQCSS